MIELFNEFFDNLKILPKKCEPIISKYSQFFRLPLTRKSDFVEFVLGLATRGSLTRRSEGHLAFYRAYYDFYSSIFAVDFLCFSRNVTNCRITT